jgi:N-acetylgalactosamine 4-sulfate 6-O-sulfotransferase
LLLCLTFTGLRDLTDNEWIKVLGVARTNEQSSRYPKMLPETRKLLTDFYAPFNEKLSQLMGGDSRWLWKDSSSRSRRRSGGEATTEGGAAAAGAATAA